MSHPALFSEEEANTIKVLKEFYKIFKQRRRGVGINFESTERRMELVRNFRDLTCEGELFKAHNTIIKWWSNNVDFRISYNEFLFLFLEQDI